MIDSQTMGRYANPFPLIQRPKGTDYWYYKLEGWTDYKTTKTKIHADALRFVHKAFAAASKRKQEGRTFAEYAGREGVAQISPGRE